MEPHRGCDMESKGRQEEELDSTDPDSIRLFNAVVGKPGSADDGECRGKRWRRCLELYVVVVCSGVFVRNSGYCR